MNGIIGGAESHLIEGKIENAQVWFDSHYKLTFGSVPDDILDLEDEVSTKYSNHVMDSDWDFEKSVDLFGFLDSIDQFYHKVESQDPLN